MRFERTSQNKCENTKKDKLLGCVIILQKIKVKRFERTSQNKCGKIDS